MDVRNRIVTLDDDLPCNAVVQDGLGTLSLKPLGGGDGSPEPSCHAPREAIGGVLRSDPTCSSASTTNEVKLLSGAAVRKISMPDAQRIGIRQGRLISPPKPRSATMELRPDAVYSLSCFQNTAGEVKDASCLLLMNPTIGTAAHIFELPHRRKSTNLETLNDSEWRSFLREWEVLKHLPSGRAELLAVFHHVPIEVISRLRFLEERKEIEYSIPGEPKRTQTRVHDMAAIRDTATREIHLVPHRTRSRSVSIT